MKSFFSLVMAIGFVAVSFAQEQRIVITTDKTTSLVFPYSIKHADRGAKDVLVEAVPGADHILLVKAAAKDFPATNLSIVTDEGSVYSIEVAYGQPQKWVYHFPVLGDTPVSAYAKSLLNNPATLKGTRDVSWGVEARLIGLYIKGAVLYCQLQLVNSSSIDYDIAFLRLYIRDKHRAKRTAVQEIELTPLHVTGDTSIVKANTAGRVVAALRKFTIPEGKYLAIEIGEHNGGRNLLLRTGNKKIIHAIPLRDQK